MANNEITTGTSPTTFVPDDTLRRAQVAAFLHRLADEPSAPPHNFSDVIAGWQQDAVSWMSHTGITTGTSPTTFAPEDTLTRAQLVTFLYRYQGEPDVTINLTTPTCQAPSTTEPATDTPTTTVWREATERIPVEAVTTYVQHSPMLPEDVDPITYGATEPMRLEPGMRLVTDVDHRIDGAWIIGFVEFNNSADQILMFVCSEGPSQTIVVAWAVARGDTDGVYQVGKLYWWLRQSAV